MDDFTPQELQLMEKMSPEHRALMFKLTRAERRSLAQHVTPEDIEIIQSWIGTDKAIEEMLFWDKGGKYDDPKWRWLKPVDSSTAVIYEKARERYECLRLEAVESQRRSDLTLYSQFNAGLLYTGLAGAVRCNENGEPDEKGDYFKGIEWRCVGSVEEYINSITLFPLESGKWEIHLGPRVHGRGQGIDVYTGDSHSLLQAAQLSEKVLPKHGFETRVETLAGDPVNPDPKAIRRAVSGDGERVDYGRELRFYASARADDAEKALELADILSYRFYERFGLETECYKIGKKYANFYLMREDNFDDFLPDTPVSEKGLVLLTATLVCRRCRREMEEFRNLARDYPHIKAVLVNLSSPQFKFYERVFSDMGGGDQEEFRRTATGVTPFIIIYAPDEKGVLRFAEYIATGKAEHTPSIKANMHVLDMYFRDAPVQQSGRQATA